VKLFFGLRIKYVLLIIFNCLTRLIIYVDFPANIGPIINSKLPLIFILLTTNNIITININFYNKII